MRTTFAALSRILLHPARSARVLSAVLTPAALASVAVLAPITFAADAHAASPIAVLPASASGALLKGGAALHTQTDVSCDDMRARITDIAGYPDRFSAIKSTRVLAKDASGLTYETEVGVVFLTGQTTQKMTRLADGRVQFVDQGNGAMATWRFRETKTGGCLLRYTIKEDPRNPGDVLKLAESFQTGAAPITRIALSLAAFEGFVDKAKHTRPRLRNGEIALGLRWKKGQVVGIQARRALQAPVSTVVGRLERLGPHLGQSALGVNGMSVERTAGNRTTWKMKAYGGTVNFTTARSVQQDGDTWVVTERVVDGDLDTGHWTYRVRRVSGQTEVALDWRIEPRFGSFVYRQLTNTHHDASMHIALYATVSTLSGLSDLAGPTTIARP